MISMRTATHDDALRVAALLRDEDAAELVGLGYATATEGVVASVRDSVAAWLIESKSGEPLGLAGYAVSNIIATEAHPWLVTTRHVEQHRMEFARASVQFVDGMREDFALLENWVDARYARCVSWLQWLGFDVEPPVQVPPTQLYFRRFTMKGNA